ncbi:hypothetical protein A9Q81_11965 [Gammaproteobacteria bacterium 42_54_T18]|nr:hypothetical protein A9Q81_11965 [Gammaproteobacteria bacterium 42_54_T18]
MKFLSTICLFSLFTISGCIPMMTAPGGGKETKILMLSLSKDQFEVVHVKESGIPRLRTKTYATLDPGWTLSELFDAYTRNSLSKYTFISGMNAQKPKKRMRHNSDEVAAYLKKVAKQYHVDYVLLLITDYPLATYGTASWVATEADYGYESKVYRHWTQGDLPDAVIYLSGTIKLYNVSELGLDTRPIYCSGHYMGHPIDPVGLLEVNRSRINVEKITPHFKETVFQTAEKSFENYFQKALEHCKLIPSSEPKLPNTENQSQLDL